VNVVDSSGWLEYFAAGPNAGFFAPALEAVDDLVVPTVSINEVFKRVLQQRGEGDALLAVALMQQGDMVDLVGAPRARRCPLECRATDPDGRRHHPDHRTCERRDALDSRPPFRGDDRRRVRPCGVGLTSPSSGRSERWTLRGGTAPLTAIRCAIDRGHGRTRH
jgi:hypothetical protein